MRRSDSGWAETSATRVGGVRSGVVTHAGAEEGEQLPAASQARTEWQYWTAGRRPETFASARATFATTVSPLMTSYRSTPTSSVAGSQRSASSVSALDRAATPAGTVGGVTSGGASQACPDGGERFPAASRARTE